MDIVKIVYWEEDGVWLGYLQDYPDYWTQGETLDDLREHLKDLSYVKQLEQDVQAGRLDQLIQEAEQELKAGRCRPL